MKSEFIKLFIENLYECQIGFVKARIFTELEKNLQKFQQINHDLQLLEDNIDDRLNPYKLFEQLKTIIVVIFPYSYKNEKIEKNRHIVSRNFWGIDYHIVIKEKLKIVQDFIKDEFNGESIVLCDNHILHDRHLAYLAGLGNYGKNTLLINKKYGSYFFISLMLTDIELEDFEYDNPNYEDICKDCNRCIKACPTKAISENRFLNASRCMSYLTQSKEEIPDEFLYKFSKFSFGCDFCQMSCVYNSKVDVKILDEFIPKGNEVINVKSLENLSNKQFNERYKTLGASFRGKNVLLRNAILVSANNNDKEDLENIDKINDNGNLYLRQAINYAKHKGEK